MAISQSFLDGMRSQAGAGSNMARTAYSRSADQNQTISGNPNYVSNMPSWQQLAMQQIQNRQMLAQDPTNIRYIQPQPNMQVQQGQVPNGMTMAAPQNGGPNNLAQQMGNAGPQGMQFTAPITLQQAMGQLQGQPGRLGGAPIPRNLAAGPSGSRFVRPMMR